MNNTINQLAKRRAALIATIENQRIALADAMLPLHGALRLVDKGLNAVRYLTAHPVLVAGVTTIVVMLKSKRWFFVLEKGWMMWRLLLAAKHSVKKREDVPG